MVEILKMPDDPMAELLSIMAKLRDPDEGCQWDIEQTFATIAPYTIEEAYEVADAIERGDSAGVGLDGGTGRVTHAAIQQLAKGGGELGGADDCSGRAR